MRNIFTRTTLLIMALMFLAVVILVLAVHDVIAPQNEALVATGLTDTFEPDLWEMTLSERGNRTTVTWRRDEPPGVAHLDYLRFENGTDRVETAARIDRAWIAEALSSYERTTSLETCELGEIRLYEYDAILERQAYNLRYWVIPISETRVATLILAITVDNRPVFDEYSRRIRPDAASCP